MGPVAVEEEVVELWLVNVFVDWITKANFRIIV